MPGHTHLNLETFSSSQLVAKNWMKNNILWKILQNVASAWLGRAKRKEKRRQTWCNLNKRRSQSVIGVSGKTGGLDLQQCFLLKSHLINLLSGWCRRRVLGPLLKRNPVPDEGLCSLKSAPLLPHFFFFFFFFKSLLHDHHAWGLVQPNGNKIPKISSKTRGSEKAHPSTTFFLNNMTCLIRWAADGVTLTRHLNQVLS